MEKTMEIRKIKTDEEKIAAGLVSAVAFHEIIDDLSKKKEDWIKSEDEDWGAFSEDGNLGARIINNHFYCNFDGNSVMCGGIGAVSTLPEYRNSGAIRFIFEKLLPAARQRGEILSALYPFSHNFYRKFGYETISYKNEFVFRPEELKGHVHNGWAKIWNPGDDVSEFTKIYSEFIKNYNLSIIRDDKKMLSEQIKGAYYKDRRFCYLLGSENESFAYVVFQDKEGTVFVNEAAWKNKDGFEAILGFLARFSAEYQKIVLPVPTNFDLRHYVSNPYNIELKSRIDYMIRVMNCQEVLKFMHKPEICNFVIKIYGDEQIPENNGIWKVQNNSVTLCNENPDFEMSAKAFSQAVSGGADSEAILMRPDVLINQKADLFHKLFTKKAIYVGDHF